MTIAPSAWCALTGAGLSCTTFESGNEVLDALTTKTPDVLLSDIRMPGMDGLALLKQIKQRHQCFRSS